MKIPIGTGHAGRTSIVGRACIAGRVGRAGGAGIAGRAGSAGRAGFVILSNHALHYTTSQVKWKDHYCTTGNDK